MNPGEWKEGVCTNGNAKVAKNVLQSKKRRRLRPTRLAWPAGGEDATIGTSTNASTNSSSTQSFFHPSRRTISQHQNVARGSSDWVSGFSRKDINVSVNRKKKNDDEMWVDKYKPINSKGLCVANKKVKDVKDWIQQKTLKSTMAPSNNGWFSSTSTVGMGLNHNTKLLILVGGPGIGKSTMIHVLCKELNVSVLEWGNHYGEFASSAGAREQWNEGGGGHESQISMFEDFLTSVSFQYDPVSISTPNVEDSWTAPFIEQRGKRKWGFSGGGGGGDIQSNDVGKNGSVVLIDELPNLHTEAAEKRFRDVMNRYIAKTNTPTVFIFSNVTEGKHKPEDLERLFDERILYSPFVHVLQINPVTKAKLKSTMKDIMKKENINMSIQRSVDGYLDDLHSQSGGDIRHAIMNVQFRIGAGQFAQTSSTVKKLDSSSQKDTKLSTFHALGKLLYAKRMTEEDAKGVQHWDGIKSNGEINYHGSQWNHDRRPPLQFDPERVLEGGDIGLSGAIAFIHDHSPDFFSDITELSAAFDTLSDSAHLMSRPMADHDDYAISLCSRAVGDANKHPAPSKFRQLAAPKMYEMMRKKRENGIKMEHVCKRLSYRYQHMSLDVNIRSSGQFASQELPFVKSIIPEEVSSIASNMYSNSRYVVLDGDNDIPKNDAEKKRATDLERQNAVLSRDDIVDSSDEEENEEEAKPSAVVKTDPVKDSDKNNYGALIKAKSQHADVIVID